MPNILTVSVVDHKSDDFTDILATLDLGLFSMDPAVAAALGPAGTAVLTSDDGTQTLSVTYTTIDGEVHATGIIATALDADFVDSDLFSGNFAAPEPLGGTNWIDVLSIDWVVALFGDTRIDGTGSGGDDAVAGLDFNDRFVLAAGDDSAAGGAGNDVLIGAAGNDLLVGGPGNDRLPGGSGNDMLIMDAGNDIGTGLSGNDVFVMGTGRDVATGGPGQDLFIMASPDGNQPRSVIRDFGADDLLIFVDVPIEDFSPEPDATTLADLENGSIDGFTWRETTRGVVINAGDNKVFLIGADAVDIDLDQLLFTEASAQETLQLFDTGGVGGTLGTPPGGDPYLVYTLDNVMTVGNGTDSFDVWGGDLTGFI